MYKVTTDDSEAEAAEITQSLDKLAREGARRMILVALELGVEQCVQGLRHLRDPLGHADGGSQWKSSRANGPTGGRFCQDQSSQSE